MANFLTNDVKVFPSAYRRLQTEGKYTSEENFVNIINSIVDKDCYVLSTESTLANSEPLRVVLHGYYFEVEGFNLDAHKNCWLAIRVEQGASALVNFNTATVTPDTLDSNGEFIGLAYGTTEFTVTDTDEYKYYQLHVSENGKLLNKVRLTSDSIAYGSTEQNVTELLDSKQDNLSAGYGIDSQKLGNNEVSLTENYNETLESMADRTVGGAARPIYISNGKAVPLSASSGLKQTNGAAGSNAYKYTQAALITDGVLQSGDQAGVKFYASMNSPAESVGQNGDFWFKYSA